MSLVLSAVIFVALWILTFLPAWYLVIKLALYLKRRPLDYSKLILLFVVYEGVIILPYAVLMWMTSLASGIWTAAFCALVLLVCISSILQVVDPKKIKDALWNLYARFYDSLLNFYPYRELIEIVCKRAGEYTQDDSTVADIGCGTGNISLGLLAHDSSSRLLAVEPSKPMLNRAKKKIGAGFSSSYVKYFNTDAVGFLGSVADGSLDVVVMNNVLYTILSRKRFWSLLEKKLSKTGVAIIANPDVEGSSSLVQYHNQHASRWLLLRPGMIIVGVIDDFISQLSSDNQFLFSSEAELHEELGVANLVMSDVERCYGGEQGGIDILFTVRRRIS